MNASLPKHDIVLLGAGHTNAHILRMWRMSPLADARLTCVSDFPLATYSGMLPGTLAGLYPPDRMQIDLVRLCASAGARFIRAAVTGLDIDRRQLLLADRPPLPFDVLSIGIGSVPRGRGLGEANTILPIKPMQTFLARLDQRLATLAAQVPERPLRLAVVGAGAGGVEIAFCLPGHIRQVFGGLAYELSLIDGGDDILLGAPRKTAAVARRKLSARGVRLLLGLPVQGVAPGRLILEDGTELAVDVALWATSATAPELLGRLGLPTDSEGFLRTRATLKTVADAPIFVVGDAGTCAEQPFPKAGVYAVRQGPVLWENLRRQLRGEPLQDYVPQKGFLSLLATGDRRAILSYKGLTFHGAWCWKLKNYIDSRFMDKHQDYRPMPAPGPNGAPESATPMRCAGCGGKVAGSVLAKVLARLDIPPSDHVVLGLDRPDDAAIVRPPGGRPVVATVDFFTAFIDDPYLVGRVAALNSLSDVFALGATPLAAMTMATIPVGPPRQQEQLLYELLAGGLDEFRRSGATLIGGHTIEGPQVTIGFSLLADAGHGPARLKGGLRPGDRLVLTKPLGSGILLAAHMQARCRAEWMEALVECLLASNQPTAALAHEFDIQGVTDVTGFGLAGHLLEMLRASSTAAEVRLADLPLLAGVAELVAEGVESTLSPANRAAEADIENHRARETHRQPDPSRPGAFSAGELAAAYAAMFDPQTSGGLLLGVPERHVGAVLARLAAESPVPGAVIGRVMEQSAARPRLRLW